HPLSLIYLLSFLHPPATAAIYTLSLHDALPIFALDGFEHRFGDVAWQHDQRAGAIRGEEQAHRHAVRVRDRHHADDAVAAPARQDRKSTRLNSSHVKISYAVFCLKKKKQKHNA